MVIGRHQNIRKWTAVAAITSTLLTGCVRDRSDVSYIGSKERQTYRAHATEVAYPNVNKPLPSEVTATAQPQTILDTEDIPMRDLTLAEAMHLALQNSQVIRSAGSFLAGGPLMTNPNAVMTEYDPAITASGVLFGTRGVEAALAAFDTQVNGSMIWGRNDTITNNFLGLMENSSETADFNANVQKTFGNGGVISLNHNVSYLSSNAPGLAFPSAYSGSTGVNYALPLLAGSGTRFTQVAGPISQAFGGVSGVGQGVLIARINEDISIAQFDLALRNLVKDVEDTYWDLYQAYRNYHVAVTARDSSQGTWDYIRTVVAAGGSTGSSPSVGGSGTTLLAADEAQALDQYFSTEAAAVSARSDIYSAEIRMRRLIGLPASDGMTLRPVDEPVTAQLVPDWYVSLTEALTQRVELRTQKWNLKSLELQLEAARSLVRPQLNFVSGYNVNGFGDELLGYNAPTSTSNFYDNMVNHDHTGWNLGLQFNWTVGFRAALAQVRNYELRVAKANRVLEEQEREVTHELAIGFQEVSRAYAAAELNMNRMIAARDNVNLELPRYVAGTILADSMLRAHLRKADAEVAYYTSLVQYNKALNNLQFRKGTILTHNSIYLAEGGWTAEAYRDAKFNSDQRDYGREAPQSLAPATQPFSLQGPLNNVYFETPQAALPTPAASMPASKPAMVEPADLSQKPTAPLPPG